MPCRELLDPAARAPQREPGPEREPEQQRAEGDLEPQQEALVGAALDLDLVHDLVAGDEQALERAAVCGSRLSASTSSHSRATVVPNRPAGASASKPAQAADARRASAAASKGLPSASCRRASVALPRTVASVSRQVDERSSVAREFTWSTARTAIATATAKTSKTAGPGARATRRGSFTPSNIPCGHER